MGIEMILLDAITDEASCQYSSIWSKSPANSHSSGSQQGPLQLDLPLDELLGSNVLAGLDDINNSAQKGGLFGRKMKAGVEEEGVLLHPDFDFDDNGDIVEFDASRVSPYKRRATSFNLRQSEDPRLEKKQANTVSFKTIDCRSATDVIQRPWQLMTRQS
jgi:meiotic recombination protein REC8